MKQELVGKFIGNQKGFGFVSIEDKEDDIYIASSNTKDALNGDTVSVELFGNSSGKRIEGKVIKVIKHEKSKVVGIFQKGKNYGFVVPDDKKFGSDIFISKKDIKNIKNNQKVVAEIIKYPQNR